MKKDIKDTLQEIYKNNKEDLLDFISKEMNTREVINKLAYNNYEEYVKSIVGIECTLNDDDILNKAYDFYLDKDYVSLLSEPLKYFVGDEIDIKKEELLEDLKKAIIDYNNREFETDYKYEDFDKVFPNTEEIGLAYTTDPDGEHTIQSTIDLDYQEYRQYVDDKLIVCQPFSWKPNQDILDGIRDMTQKINEYSFNDFAYVEEDFLYQALGLKKDDEGNFYDPKELEQNQEDELEM